MTAKIDTWESTMSWEETKALMDAADVEMEKGNEDRAYEILQEIPLAPELAKCLATMAGMDPMALKTSGLNLKDAEIKYGTDWLERIGS